MEIHVKIYVHYSCTLFCTNTTLIIANTQKVKSTKLF